MKYRSFVLILCSSLLLSESTSAPDTVTIGFWNVENLFDLNDDPDKQDDEYALGGKKQATREILDLKLDHLAEVMTDLDADILGLCEVENRSIVDELKQHYTPRDYKVVHYESPDERGIDVMLFYDPDVYDVKSSEVLSIPFPGQRPTRDILHVTGTVQGAVLHVFVNHWPSNYYGWDIGSVKRKKVAGVLRAKVDDILADNPQAEIVIMGDLNEGPADSAVTSVLKAGKRLGANGPNLLDLMHRFDGVDGVGTYVYRGEDGILDHIIISSGLTDEQGLTMVENSIRINDKPKYRQQSGRYKHYPFRFWAGDSLLGGYSDHLAVAMDIILVRQ